MCGKSKYIIYEVELIQKLHWKKKKERLCQGSLLVN